MLNGILKGKKGLFELLNSKSIMEGGTTTRRRYATILL